jgi:hypothetical protein
MGTPSITLSGTVRKVCEKQNVTDTFSKRMLWMDIDEDGEYTQQIEVEFVNDHCAKLNGIKDGDHVIVDVNIRGKEFESKKEPGVKFRPTKLQAWRIKGSSSADLGDAPDAPTQAPQTDAGEDDLPF